MAGLRNKKAKGTAAERELVHKFWDHDWACVRIAGSGSSRYPAPDLLAGNGHRKIAIECKTVTKDKVYITKDQINGLIIFSETFGTERYVGVKFDKEWYFLSLDDIPQTTSSFVISLELAKMKGLIFDELLGVFN